MVCYDRATAEQVKTWPVVHTYDQDTGDYLHTDYTRFARLAEGETQGTCTGPQNPGDGLFCKVTCAVAFARIAANMGLRLPSVTKREQRARRQYHRFLRALTPAELEPARPKHDPAGPLKPCEAEVWHIRPCDRPYQRVGHECLDPARLPAERNIKPKP